MNVIISGASKGIGRAIALKFAQSGHHVAVCSRNSSNLDTIKHEIQQIRPDIHCIAQVADISVKEDIERFADECISNFGTIDVVVNNGGIYLPGKVTDEPTGKLEKLIETNLYSAYHLTRAVLPHMKNSKKPHIFNICSVASLFAYPDGGSYSISKFALLGFSKVLREELKSQGIKVTALLPGATWSDSWAGVDLPYERLMDANDIADLLYATYQLGPSAVVEELIIRPMEGDL